VIVYLLTNLVSKKCYVGQTRHSTLEKRWNRTLSNVHANGHLSKAIRKYGPDQFQRTILSYASCQEELDLLERFWIAFYRSNQRQYGYNLQAGGVLWRGNHTLEVRKRIGKSSKRQWDNRSPKDRWEFALATRLRWLSRTEDEREEISRNITKALIGKPRTDTVWNKGLRLEGKPKTEEHRMKIGLGIRRHYEQKRREEVWMTAKKPPTSAKVQRQVDPLVRKEPTAVKGLKEIEATRRELRAIQKRLNQLEFEFKGGCEW
jgi:group I intron endonuclease